MLSKKKQKALLIVTVTGLILIACVSVAGYLVYLVYPLLLALICIIIGMIAKWSVEWVVRNIDRFRVKERAETVKKKLKIDKGVDMVKDSIDTLRHDDEKNTEVPKASPVAKVENPKG